MWLHIRIISSQKKKVNKIINRLVEEINGVISIIAVQMTMTMRNQEKSKISNKLKKIYNHLSS